MSEIREAVQIVIDRMRAHPEEFTKHGKLYWITLILDTPEGPWRNGLNDAEMAALNKEYAEINYRIFHSNVMKSLLEEGAPPPMQRQGSSLKYTPLPTIDPRTIYEAAGKMTPEEKENVRQLLELANIKAAP